MEAVLSDPLGVNSCPPEPQACSPPAVRARGELALAQLLGDVDLRTVSASMPVAPVASPALRTVSASMPVAPVASPALRTPVAPVALRAPPKPPPAPLSFEAGKQQPRSALLAGELVLLSEPLVLDLANPSVPRDCALYLTNHRILLEGHDDLRHVLSVSVSSLSRIRRSHAPSGRVREHRGATLELVLELSTQTNARPALRLQGSERPVERLLERLRQLRALCPLALSFACAHAAAMSALGAHDDGWQVFEPHAEFQRQGLLNPLSCWRVSEANEGFRLCASYPPWLCTPKSVTDEALHASAAFRASRRFPSLCWKDPHSFASISRAGQPLVGLNGKRSREDEALLAALRLTNPEQEVLAIVDCRPRLNAEANNLLGKGYESSANYAGTSLRFVDVQNIHVVRESMRRLLAALEPREDGAQGSGAAEWLRELGGSGWLEHVQSVLRGSRAVVDLVAEHRSVLVHCSDGWDRTSQLTALAQLQLDAHFRTLRGFALLVEKEWLAYGHQFAIRTGSPVHGVQLAEGAGALPPAPSEEQQQSPVFVQFVDCVWQLTLRCPSAFEFSQLFLASVLEHVYSGQFGTFFLDTHAMRRHNRLPQCTRSLWSELLDRPAQKGFVNPWYAPTAGILDVDLSGSSFEVFKAFYCRGPSTVDPRDVRAMAERSLTELGQR